jgi:predicted ATPase
MLSKFKVQRYKSLFDTEIELEPLTVFIGPNGSGKSNICEALAVLSNFSERVKKHISDVPIVPFFLECLRTSNENEFNVQSKFWRGEIHDFLFEMTLSEAENSTHSEIIQKPLKLSIFIECTPLDSQRFSVTIQNQKNDQPLEKLFEKIFEFKEFISRKSLISPFEIAIKKVNVYDFIPNSLSTKVSSTNSIDRSGKNITNSLVDILHENRERFIKLEKLFTELIPNIERISLPRGENQSFELELIDKYSDHHISSTEISDGTLRILGFLTALYQKETPSIICFEELENGVHPWLLHKMMELLKIVSTEGINGKPVQVLITTHSPLLLNYVEPYQVRAVELDGEGKTQVHKLPIDSVRFQKALEAYDGELGELWFTNVFGGNPT